MKKQLKGKVISTKAKKTATVEVEKWSAHPLYKKIVKKRKKYLVQDDLGVKEGSRVIIEECRPISKRKRFRIIKIIDS